MNYENVEVNSERWLRLEPLLNEEWKDVPGYEGLYQVSNYGRVKTLKIYNEKNRHQNTIILKASIYGTNDVKRKLGFCPSDIWACCNSKIKTAYGYYWRYEDE